MVRCEVCDPEGCKAICVSEQRYRLFWSRRKEHFESFVIHKTGKGSTIKEILEYLEIYPATALLAEGYDWRLECAN